MSARSETGSAWDDFNSEPVADGVVRIPLPLRDDGLRAVNVYLVETEAGIILIDSGWAIAEAWSHLEKSVEQLGHKLSHIARILVTHAHRDHYTLGLQLRAEFGARVGLGEAERPSIDALTSGTARRSRQLSQLRRAGAGSLADRIAAITESTDAVRDVWESPDEWLSRGCIRLGSRSLEVIPTPGHTRGHIVFADLENGLLFSGDHVLPHITPSIGFEAAPTSSPLGDYLDSLHRVHQLPDLKLLPAHGAVAESVHARIDQLIAHHDLRLERTLELVRALRAATAYEVAMMLTWTRRERRFTELDDFNRMLAVTETAAHLDLLAASGVLLLSGEETPRYSARIGAEVPVS